MKTRKNIKNLRSKTSKTSKNKIKNPSIKIFNKGFPIFASKVYSGDQILKYTSNGEKKTNDHCLFENISWFGDYIQAKSYKTKETNINKWIIKKETRLLNMNHKNESFFEKIFKSTDIVLGTAVNIPDDKVNKIKNQMADEKMQNFYIDMTQNERALYEFKFAYGYISVEEQYQFMKFLKFLIKNKYTDIKMREGTSIINKLTEKIDYYYYLNKTNTKQKYNRLSIYAFDKYALNNLCKIMPSKYKIDGVFQANDKSFWFPDLLVYKMNIKEYVLYNPHHNLKFEGIVE
jgi:hypothetical protein